MLDDLHTITTHYENGRDGAALVARIQGVLDGLPPGPLDDAQLGGLDQFHVRGLAATAELAALAGVATPMNVLDAGSGLGGPSRYLARTYGCRVTGVDLTPSYVEVSQLLAERSGLAAVLRYEVGNLLALPFPDAAFDLVWTQHAVMNVRDRDELYRELRRVLKPDGALAFYDAIAGDDALEPYYPVPWAESAETSCLLTRAATLASYERAGFDPAVWNDVTAPALTWFAEQQAGAPQRLGLGTVMGPRLVEMTANFARNLREGRVRLVMGTCHAANVPR